MGSQCYFSKVERLENNDARLILRRKLTEQLHDRVAFSFLRSISLASLLAIFSIFGVSDLLLDPTGGIFVCSPLHHVLCLECIVEER